MHDHICHFFCWNRGAALLVEAAEMGDPDAQYTLGSQLRIEVRVYALYCEDMI